MPQYVRGGINRERHLTLFHCMDLRVYMNKQGAYIQVHTTYHTENHLVTQICMYLIIFSNTPGCVMEHTEMGYLCYGSFDNKKSG